MRLLSLTDMRSEKLFTIKLDFPTKEAMQDDFKKD